MGCNFILLVVETFGVWSLRIRIYIYLFIGFTSMLQTIADHTTACSGTSTKLARKHFFIAALCFFVNQ